VPWGIDGITGNIIDMRNADIWEPMAVKLQTFKSSIEAACLLLRIDDIVSGIKKKDKKEAPTAPDDDVTAPIDE